MWRAALKGAGLFVIGRFPGGAHLYREATRNWMGTQATHVDKLSRVWPGYVSVWESCCGLRLDGLDVWVHEGGWTPYPFLVNFLLTGKAGTVTNGNGRMLDRYLSRAVNGALSTTFPANLVSNQRCLQVEPLRWYNHTAEAIGAINGTLHESVKPSSLPLASDCMDLCHSGGSLEHYRPNVLRGFLSECYRILKPGGIASHVFDHRDHLHHADQRWPFLAHLAFPSPLYSLFCGHALSYHNRLLPTEVIRMFEEVGFERIAVRRMILPDRRYVEGEAAMSGTPGISRRLLRGRYRGASDIDLRTAAAHYLFRKPAVS